MAAAVVAMSCLAAAPAANAESRTANCSGCTQAEYRAVARDLGTLNGDISYVFDYAARKLTKYMTVKLSVPEFGIYLDDVYPVPLDADEAVLMGPDTVTLLDAIDVQPPDIQACGPGAIGDWLVPDLGFGGACENHDFCYGIGGDEEARSVCDRGLLTDALAACDCQGFGCVGRPFCEVAARAFYMAVRQHGGRFFNYGGYTGGHPGGTFGGQSDILIPLSGCAGLKVCIPYTDDLLSVSGY
jgi:hypothetical protein